MITREHVQKFAASFIFSFIATLINFGVILPMLILRDWFFDWSFFAVLAFPLSLLTTIQIRYIWQRNNKFLALSLDERRRVSAALKTGVIPKEKALREALWQNINRFPYREVDKQRVGVWVMLGVIFALNILISLSQADYTSAVPYAALALVFGLAYYSSARIKKNIPALRKQLEEMGAAPEKTKTSSFSTFKDKVFWVIRFVAGWYAIPVIMLGVSTLISPQKDMYLMGASMAVFAITVMLPYYSFKERWTKAYILLLVLSTIAFVLSLQVSYGYYIAPAEITAGDMSASWLLTLIASHSTLPAILIMCLFLIDSIIHRNWIKEASRTVALVLLTAGAIVTIITGIVQLWPEPKPDTTKLPSSYTEFETESHGEVDVTEAPPIIVPGEYDPSMSEPLPPEDEDAVLTPSQDLDMISTPME